MSSSKPPAKKAKPSKETPPAKKAKLSEETPPTETVSPENFEPHNVVTIIVGQEKRMFQMFQHLLCKESEFFKAKCSGRLPTDNGVDLTDLPVHIFGVFLVWLSTGSIVDSKGKIFALYNYEAAFGSQFTQLVHCYLLADRLLAQRFQNCIADEICKFLDDKKVPKDETIFANVPLVYRKTPHGSTLRHILQDATIRYGNSTTMAGQVADNPQDGLLLAEFWKELAIRAMHWGVDSYMTIHRGSLFWSRSQCRYHQHKGEEEKYLCKKESTREDKYLEVDKSLEYTFPGFAKQIKK